MPALNISTQTLGAGSTVTWTTRNVPPVNVSAESLSKGSAVNESMTVVRTTVNTPGFATKGVGPLPVHNFFYEEKARRWTYGVSLSNDMGYDTTTWYRTIGPQSGYSPTLTNFVDTTAPSPPGGPSVTDVLDRKARAEVLTRIKDMKVNMAQAFAEREQTVRLFADTAKRIANTLISLKHGNIIEAASHLGLPVSSKRQRARVRSRVRSAPRRAANQVANDWLALQYGWKPLLSDITGAAESLAKRFNQPIRSFSHSRASKTTKDLYLNYVYEATSGATIANRKLDPGRRTGTVVVNGKSEISYALQYSASNQSHWPTALGLTNPLELAWELLPYSFVADWFINVGQTLSTLDATVGLQFLQGTKTTFHKYTWVSEGSQTGVTGSRWYQYSNGVQTFTWVYVKREVLTDFPSPALPVFKDNPFTSGHIANAAALVVTAAEKFLSRR